MKKIFSLLLAGVLSLGLVGCGGSSKSDETTKSDLTALAGKTLEFRGSEGLLLSTNGGDDARVLTLSFGDVDSDGKNIEVKTIAARTIADVGLFLASTAANGVANAGDALTLSGIKMAYDATKKVLTLNLSSIGVADTQANAQGNLKYETLTINLLTDFNFTSRIERFALAVGVKGVSEEVAISGAGSILVK